MPKASLFAPAEHQMVGGIQRKGAESRQSVQ